MELVAGRARERVDEALESVQIFLVLCQERPWITSGLVHARHASPLLPEQVETLAVSDHHFLRIAAANSVDVAVTEGVVSGETSSTDNNVLLPLDTFRD